MTPTELLILGAAGLVAGILAGFLGIGGGTVLVPLLVALGDEPVKAVATSSLSIVITAISGSVQNWRMGYLDLNRVIGIGFPAVITAQLGAYLANLFPPYWLLLTFGLLLLLNIYLVEIRRQITTRKKQEEEQSQREINSGDEPQEAESFLPPPQSNVSSDFSPSSNIFFNPVVARLTTGGVAGVLAGLFGVGGGIIMVPLQILWLGEPIKVAIQTSLGVIIITAISACAGHAIAGNVLWVPGFVLGLGGLLGAQISTRFLPKLSDAVISLAFRTLLGILSIYIFWQAWQSYVKAS